MNVSGLSRHVTEIVGSSMQVDLSLNEQKMLELNAIDDHMIKLINSILEAKIAKLVPLIVEAVKQDLKGGDTNEI